MSELAVFEERKFFLRAGDEILDPARKQDLPKITAHLAAPNAVSKFADNGQAEVIITLIRMQDADGQRAILAADDVVWGLAENRQAEVVIALIRMQDADGQRAILAADGATRGLVRNGQAHAVKQIQASWENEDRPVSPKAPQYRISNREA